MKFILALLALAAIICFAQAEATCKVGALIAFEPTACDSCTYCSGSKSSSCCNVAIDTALKTAMAFVDAAGVPAACSSAIKTYACAKCDAKNQQYVTGTLGADFTVCKAQCQSMVSACTGVTGFSDMFTAGCDALPETNCWNAASTAQASLVAIVALLSVVLALF